MQLQSLAVAVSPNCNSWMEGLLCHPSHHCTLCCYFAHHHSCHTLFWVSLVSDPGPLLGIDNNTSIMMTSRSKGNGSNGRCALLILNYFYGWPWCWHFLSFLGRTCIMSKVSDASNNTSTLFRHCDESNAIRDDKLLGPYQDSILVHEFQQCIFFF